MRAQSTVIGMALFVIAMIFTGAVFLSLVAKTARLLDAGRREIEFLTEKAKEDLGVSWRWEPVVGSQGYPILIINNMGSIPVEIVQVRVSLRKRSGDMWPYIVQGPWIVATNKSLGVGETIKVKVNHILDWNQLRQWYLNNMTKILEARILTRRGNVFRSVYVPTPPPHPRMKPEFNAILFYWSALDWMDIENTVWWHGDLLGYYKMTTPDDAWAIAGGNIEIPKWYTESSKTITFRFMAYLPGLDSNGHVADTNNFLVLAIEYIDRGQSGPYPASVKTKFELSIKNLEGNTVYSVTTQEVTDPGSSPRTAYFKLDPSNPKFVIIDLHDETLGNTPKNLEPGWYIIELKITFSRVSSGSVWLGLKSIFLYISNEELW